MTKDNEKPKEGEYIEDVVEAEKDARNYGDKEVLVAGEGKDKKEEVKPEKVGNQSKEYYKQ